MKISSDHNFILIKISSKLKITKTTILWGYERGRGYHLNVTTCDIEGKRSMKSKTKLMWCN